ncbi:hypothetical protein [Acidisphaera sp. L21]|jgi:hypothetical protein|nr:hypothetical protein [Acidisphaera sp. L21]
MQQMPWTRCGSENTINDIKLGRTGLEVSRLCPHAHAHAGFA